MLHWTGYPPLIAAALYLATMYYAFKRDKAKLQKYLKYATAALTISWLLYLIPFVTLDFSLHEVYWNSSVGMPLWMRLATSWSGGGGSLFLFAFIAGLALYFVRGEKVEFYLLAIPVVLVGLFAAYMNDAFTLIPGNPITGAGLNPLLKSPWLYPHPLSTFSGYGILAISAIALALGLRRAKVSFNVGWALLTIGITLGAFWSYETFGWGGYWAWDPVETSELVVWLTSTVLPHLAPILPAFAEAYAPLITSSVFLAMFVTRTGLSPLHSFAGANLGSISLLFLSVAYLLWFIKRLSDWDAYKKQIKSLFEKKSPFTVGLTLAAIALLTATFFVYGTLFVPSLMVAMGKEASIPQMSSGIEYFHPVLYPILALLLISLPLIELSDLGWRTALLVIASGLILSATAALAVFKGTLTLAHLSPVTTNAMMAFGIPLASIAIASSLYYIARRYRRIRDVEIGLIHLGMALTALGVLMSGTYAFNNSYFYHFNLPPNKAEALPNNMKLMLESYNYSLSKSFVDIFDNYVQRSSVYFYAWLAIKTIANDLSEFLQQVKQGQHLIEVNDLYKFIVDKMFHGSPIISDQTMSVYEVGLQRNVTLITNRIDVINVTNNSLEFSVNQPLQVNAQNLTLALYVWQRRDGTVGYAFAALAKGLLLNKSMTLTPHQALLVHLSRKYVFLLRGGTLRLVFSDLTIYPASAPISNETVTVIPNSFIMFNGNVTMGNESYPSMGSLPIAITAYLHALSDPTVRNLLNTKMGEFLSNPKNVLSIITPPPNTKCLNPECAGYVRAPKYVPETADLYLNFKVLVPNGSDYEFKEKIRYEAYGEIQGIHGLVPKVVHPSYGLSDLYVVLNPPVKSSHLLTGISYHDLLLWYLHKLLNSKQFTEGQKLALTALFAAGYNINFINQVPKDQLPTFLELATIELYNMAKNYRSLIATEGLYVQAKVIPGMIFVWTGPSLMSFGALLGALYYYYVQRNVASVTSAAEKERTPTKVAIRRV